MTKTDNTTRSAPRALIGLLALGGMTLSMVAGCGRATGKPAPAALPTGPAVSAAFAITRPIRDTQAFSGRLEAVDHVQIRPRVAGYITAVGFLPGAEVRKGQLLFQIDPRPYQAELDRAEAAAGAARARADLASVELDRAQRLLGDKAIAQREYDASASGRKELDAAARAAEAQVAAARLNLDYTRVTAPIDGRVSKAEITPGNLVDASSVLTSVVSLERIYASFDGDEATFLRVSAQAHRGEPIPVGVGLTNEDGFPHKGKLEFVDNQLDTRTGSIRMRAVFDNKERSMAPGLFARVEIGGGQARDAVLIGDRAVGTDQGRKFVYVVGTDGKVVYRDVKLGPVVEGLRVVRAGLKPGEKIVVDGLQRVKPGAAVDARTVPMLAAAGPDAKEQR